MLLFGVFSLTFLIYIISLVSWERECKKNNLCSRLQNIDLLVLGSTYAYYDLEFKNKLASKKVVKGAYIAQYLDCDSIVLNHFIPYMRQNSKVVMVFPDFVFVGKKTNMRRKHYYEGLAPREIVNYDFLFRLKLAFKAVVEPITHSYFKQENRWKGHIATFEEKELHAVKRTADWEKGLGIPNVQCEEITVDLAKRIEHNIKIALDMIETCKGRGIEVIGLIPPSSIIMKEKVSEKCLKKYLFDPVEELRAKSSIKIKNYYFDERFENPLLYINSDCLNEEGRNAFTDVVISDLGIS